MCSFSTWSYICKHKPSFAAYIQKDPFARHASHFPCFLNSKWTLHTLLTLFATRSGVPCRSAAVRISMHICKAPLVPACTSFLPSPRCVCKHILMSPAPVGLPGVKLHTPHPCECLRASLKYKNGRKNACGLDLKNLEGACVLPWAGAIYPADSLPGVLL